MGGGTPSLLTPEQISSLLEELRNKFGFQDGVEITLEVDPASFKKASLESYVSKGINRFSLGAQSFDDHLLQMLGRRHNLEDLTMACEWIGQLYETRQIKSWSLDLIQNIPGQNLYNWQKSLDRAVETLVPHLSIYELSVEPKTVFAWRQRRGELELPHEDLAIKIMRLTSYKLRKVGFSRYEISNYALPGHASRHNRVYWSGSGWWGFGQGATSAPWGIRLERPRTREGYAMWVKVQEEKGIDASLKSINATPIPLDDLVIVGLRRREGIDLDSLASQWGWSKKERDLYLKSLEVFWSEPFKRGWLKRYGSRVKLSDPLGMEISNQVFINVILWWESLPDFATRKPIPLKLL